MKIRVFEAFAGYGSQMMALKRLSEEFEGFEVECVGISEIDKYAIQAYNAVHGETRNFGDISKIDWGEVPDFDLFTYSFPCQDISKAGNQKGFAKGSGTRSGLLWECKKAIEAKRPKYLLLENVKALVSKKFRADFEKWLEYLEGMGYRNFWQVLNAKDYTVPQNRERVFVVSILDEYVSYAFPEKMPLERRLKDVLEPVVDEKYYLSPKALEKLTLNLKESSIGIKYVGDTNKGGERGVILSDEGICSALSATYYKQPKQIAVVVVEPLNDQDGLCWTIKSQYYKNSMANFVRQGSMGATGVLEARIFEVGKINSSQDGVVVHPDVVAKCLTSGHNNTPKIHELQVMTPKRTEYGKSVRKDYESGNIKESRHNMTRLEPRQDGISNTITTVQKYNLVLEPNIIQVGNLVEDKGGFKNPQTGRVYSIEGISPCLDTMGGGNREPKILEARFANKRVQSLVESGMIKGDRIQFLDTYNQSVPEEVSGTITTRVSASNSNFIAESIPIDDYNSRIPEDKDVIGAVRQTFGSSAPRNGWELLEPYMKQYPRGFNNTEINEKSYEKRRIFEKDYQRNTSEILQILRKEIGKEENKWKIRRFVCFLKTQILRQELYEKSICENRLESTGIQSGTSYGKKDCLYDTESTTNMRDMWDNQQYRHPSQGWELSEQLLREFNDCMSFLSHETAQKIKSSMYYLWKTYKGSWVLQQALSSLEEIWQSLYGEWYDYRIRKLTPRECFRLQGVSDTDIDKIQEAGISNSQQYKLAGNSIVVDCLYYIFRNLFIEEYNPSKTTLF